VIERLFKLYERFTAPAGSEGPKGAYLSFPSVVFCVLSEPGLLPGEAPTRHLRIPWLFVPAVLPALATAFMMAVPAVAIVGAAYYLWKSIRKKKPVAILLLLLLGATPFEADALPLKEIPIYPESEVRAMNHACFDCHQTTETHFTFRDQTILERRLDLDQFYDVDVHSRKEPCQACHVQYTPTLHPQIAQFESLKDYRLARYELCRKCHEEQYQQMKGSVHFKLLSEGNLKPPVCTDCHNVHRITSFKDTRRAVVEMCRKCHGEIYDQYRQSVHGRALVELDNQDVPTCVDCHAAHKVADPRLVESHILTPEICAKCHANEKLMEKYGLRSDVYQTYLEDFHGVTVKFYRETGQITKPKRIEAVCVDCHGIHGIKRVNEPGGAIDRTYVNKMCERCHEDIPPGFSSAWLSHYRPSLTRYPLVFAAKAFYWFFIPFTLLGLAIHMGLHFQRHVRKKRSSHE